MATSTGGAGGIGGGGGLTADFPSDRQPERNESAAASFEKSATTDRQANQLEEELRLKERNRQTPEVQGMDYTIGGTVEQAVHTEAFTQREKEILALKERIQRRNERTRGQGR